MTNNNQQQDTWTCFSCNTKITMTTDSCPHCGQHWTFKTYDDNDKTTTTNISSSSSDPPPHQLTWTCDKCKHTNKFFPHYCQTNECQSIHPIVFNNKPIPPPPTPPQLQLPSPKQQFNSHQRQHQPQMPRSTPLTPGSAAPANKGTLCSAHVPGLLSTSTARLPSSCH